MNWPRIDKITEAGSSSLHSSKASITIMVEMLDSMRGLTISSFIWLYKDPQEIPGSDCTNGMKTDRNLVYLWAS